MNISRLELDRISGVANGYSAAVLSDTATKRIGANTIGPLLAALGVKLALIEDPDAMARYTVHAEQRVPNMAHAGRLGRNAMNRAKLVIFAELGRRGGLARFAKLNDAEKTALGRRAALKRWRQYRLNHPPAVHAQDTA